MGIDSIAKQHRWPRARDMAGPLAMLLLGLTLSARPLTASAQSPPAAPAAAATTPAPAPAAAAPAAAAAAPAAAAPAASPTAPYVTVRQDQLRRHRLDADLHRAGADDDHPGPGAVLRRHGAQEERARDADAELRDHLPGDGPVVDGRLLAGLHPRQYPVHRQPALVLHERRGLHARRHEAERLAPGDDHPRDGLRRCSRRPSRSSPRR